MPNNYYMQKLLILLFFSSCIQTNNPSDSGSPEKPIQPSTQIEFENNIQQIKSIDARKIFKAKIVGDLSKQSQINITFIGRDKPSLRFYKHELKSGMEFSIIPPKGSMDQVIIEPLGMDLNPISKTIKKLKSGEVTIISL